MQWRNDPSRWGVVAQTLHWGIALAVIALVLVGLLMQELPNSPLKLRVYALHKSVGLTVLVLVVLRLAWRLIDRRPAHPPGMPRWQRRLAALVHGLLYGLLLAMPLTGWLYNSASNFPLRWFDLVRIPPLAAADPELKALALALHSGGFYLLAALFALHVGAALKHHYLDRDRTLVAMLPFQPRQGAP
jgi:cytochrome b561